MGGPKLTVFHDTAAPDAITAIARMEVLAEHSQEPSAWRAAAAEARADNDDPVESSNSLASATKIPKKVSKKSLEAGDASPSESRKSWVEDESPDASPKSRAGEPPVEEEASPELLNIDVDATLETEENLESPAPQNEGTAEELAPPAAASKKKKPTTKKSKTAASAAAAEAEAPAEEASPTAAADNDDGPDLSSSSIPKGKKAAKKKKPK